VTKHWRPGFDSEWRLAISFMMVTRTLVEKVSELEIDIPLRTWGMAGLFLFLQNVPYLALTAFDISLLVNSKS